VVLNTSNQQNQGIASQPQYVIGESGGSATATLDVNASKLISTTQMTINSLGTVNMLGANSFSNFTLSGGQFNVANSISVSLSANSASSGGTVSIGTGANLTMSGRLNKTGSQTLTISGGTLTVVTSASSGGWRVTRSAAPASGIDVDVTAVIAGTSGLVLGNSSFGSEGASSNDTVVRLSGANTYTGTTRFGSGQVWLAGNASNDGTTASVLGRSTGDVVIGQSANGNTVAVLIDGPYTIARNFSYNTGGVNGLNSSTVGGRTAHASEFSGNFNLENNNATQAPALSLTAVAGGTVTFSGVISSGANARGFTKTGAGTVILSGANTYLGATTVSAGTLQVSALADGGVASSLGQSTNAASNLVLNSGTLTHIGSGNSATNRAFSLAASSTIESSGTGTLSFTDPAVPLTYGTANEVRTLTLRGTNTGANDFGKNLGNNGSGALAVTKTDAGRWILSGTNTYTGATSVQAGVLLIDGSTGSSAVSVSSGAVIGGDGTIGGNLTLSNGGLFAFDTGSTLSLTGNLSLNSSFGVASLRSVFGSAVDWAAVSAGTYTLMNTSFSFNDTNISNFGEANQATDLAGGRSAYFQQGTSPTNSLQLVVVPEPATLAVAAAATGLVGLGLYRRRRQGPRA
jgi:fibronectin-binding autotransporter adhesin